jgi:hypothetical protein
MEMMLNQERPNGNIKKQGWVLPHYHLPKMAVMRHINCLSDALGTFYALYSLYIHTLYTYILGEQF